MALLTTSGLQTFTLVHHLSNAVWADLQTDINTFITGTLDTDADNYYAVNVQYLWDGTNYNASVIYTRYEINTEFGVEA